MQYINKGVFAGHPLQEFGAKLQAYPSFSREIDASVFQGSQRSAFTVLRNRRGGLQLHCSIDFFGDNETRTANQTAFEALFLGLAPVEIDIGDGYTYRAVLISEAETSPLGEILTSVEYRFHVTRHKQRQEVTIIGYEMMDHAQDGAVFCQSNVKQTDCVITVERVVTGEDIDKNLMVLRLDPNNLSVALQTWSYAGRIRESIVLDGERKILLVDGENVTNQVSWTDFPYLEPGKNVFTLWLNGVQIADPFFIAYTPTYL